MANQIGQRAPRRSEPGWRSRLAKRGSIAVSRTESRIRERSRAFISVEPASNDSDQKSAALRRGGREPRRSEASLSIPPLFHVSIEARRPGCTVTTTNRENRRRSPEFQREENNRRPCCADNGVSAVADNRGRYQLDLVGGENPPDRWYNRVLECLSGCRIVRALFRHCIRKASRCACPASGGIWPEVRCLFGDSPRPTSRKSEDARQTPRHRRGD